MLIFSCRARFRCLASGLVWVLLLVGRTNGEEGRTIPVDEAIRTLEAVEKWNASYVYRFEYSVHMLSDGNDPSSVVSTEPQYGRGTVYYDVATGRYLLECEGVSRWSDGAAPFIAERESWSFDGRNYWRWSRFRHGKELPPLEQNEDLARRLDVGPLVGEVTSAEDSAGFVQMRMKQAGLMYMPPFVWTMDQHQFRLTALSEELRQRVREGLEVEIKEDSVTGEWVVVLERRRYEQEEIRIRVDPNRGFAMTLMEWAQLKAPPPGIWKRLIVKHTQVEKDVWVPEEIIELQNLSKMAYKIVISDFQYQPELTEETFRARFPIGTLVDDFVEEKSYIVSNGPVEDAKAVEEFILRHKVAWPDEEEPTAPSWSSWRWTFYLLNGAALLAIVILALLKRHKRSGRKSRNFSPENRQ